MLTYTKTCDGYLCACGFLARTLKGLKIHYTTCKTTNPNPKDKSKEWTDEKRKQQSENVKRLWLNDDYRENNINKQKALWENPEMHERMSEKLKEIFTDPTIKQKMSDSATKRFADANEREKQSERLKQYNETHPEHKQVLSDNQKTVWERPGFRENQYNKMNERWSNEEEHKKQSETIKKLWMDSTFLETRMNESVNKQKETWKNKTDDEREVIKQNHQNSWRNKSDDELKTILLKTYNTKKQNNTFNTSKIETELKNYFDSNNIEYISQYKSDLYPFSCDFYFPDKDLYVEIQGSWTHGGKPYIETDRDCIKQLELWKSKNSKYYNNAINTWTIRDVNKRNIAKQNNLNFIEIFTTDINKCLEIIVNVL